jgi:hypothetical protein
MPGAASLVLANFLYSASARDGLAFGAVQRGMPLNPLYSSGSSAGRYDAARFTWIGSISSETGALLAMSRAGLRSFADLFAKGLIVGAEGGGTSDSELFAKRLTPDGHARWPSTESVAKSLAATGTPIDVFVQLISDSGVVAKKSVPLIGLAQAVKPGYFDDAGFPAGHGWDEIALLPSLTSMPMRWTSQHLPVLTSQRGLRVLPQFDPDLVGWLMEKFGDIGTHVRTDNTVTAIEGAGQELSVQTRTSRGMSAVSADLAVHAAGRVPDIAELNLSVGHVDTENGRLRLNEYLQSVAGDAAAQGPPLTPVSRHDGKVVAANILEGNRHRPDYRGVPSVAFTLPPIGAVGLSESAACKQAAKLRVKSEKVPEWQTARRVGESVYGYKTLVEENSGRILGAHLVGPNVDEVINLFGLAIRHDLNADDLKTTMFAYPKEPQILAML